MKSVLFVSLLAMVLTLHSNVAGADDNHSGHSDDLLLLIQQKIHLTKLQTQLESAPSKDAQSNLAQQNRLLSRALNRLQRYVATSSGHYPNDALYQQSLENRAVMLNDFAKLLANYHQQANRLALNGENPDGGQHAH